MLRILFGFLILLGLKANAQQLPAENPSAPTDPHKQCTYYYRTANAFHYYRDEMSDGVCYLNAVYNLDTKMIYRSYLFSNEGIFMVFNSYGPEEGSNSTGARVYYFFPRDQKPHGYENETGLIFESSSSRASILTDSNNGRILEIKGSKFLEADKVSRDNKGGLEIYSHHSLWLDLGFAIGQDPSMKPNADAIFHDENGASCVVKMKELHDYPNHDVRFKFKKDSELVAFLKVRCPGLSLRSMGGL